MKRELARMTRNQVYEWGRDRQREVDNAFLTESITADMYSTLTKWIDEEILAWEEAYALGLVGRGI